MSDKEVKNEKVMTKYDQKMQRRKENKAKEKREERITTAIVVLMLVAFVAFVASFPIRAYMAGHETVVTINGEKVSRVEFDYNYNNSVNDFMNANGTILGFMGLDISQDFSQQMYDENRTWQDYFEEMTVENMKKTKAMKAEADKVGFEFDASSEIADFKTAINDAAETAGMSTKDYVKQLYGEHATVKNLTKYIEEGARINAYYEQVSKDMAASDEEIEAYYEENSAEYDCVDYFVSEFPAEITAESPTEEDIEKAMNAACDLADAAADNVDLQGDEMIGDSYYDVPSAISSWLFDDARKGGDVDVIEDLDNNMYYAVEFTKRYRNENPTADVRVIVLNEDNGQAVLDEWKAGAATAESFGELCKKYTVDSGAIANGGLMSGVSKSGVSEELADWIFAEERGVGDTTSITLEAGGTYVLYYVGQSEPEWKVNVAAVLLSQKQTEYMNNIAQNVTVEGKLNYMKIEEELAATVSDGDAAVSEGDVSGN